MCGQHCLRRIDHYHTRTTGHIDLQPLMLHAGHRLSRVSTLSNEFAKLLAAAGLREKVSHSKEKSGRGAKRELSALTFHSLRHTAVSLLKEAGVDQATVMELIGHESAQMSNIYTHVSEKFMKEAAAKLPMF